MGPGPFPDGKPKVSRGDVRLAILHLLGEEPMHGYQIIQEISDRTDGVWQPSPGSVYPTLQQLEDEGLVESEQRDGRNVFALTPDGTRATQALDAPPPWERMDSDVDGELLSLREAGFQVGGAVMQVARAGSRDQVDRTIRVLNDARKKIYQILADDDAAAD